MLAIYVCKSVFCPSWKVRLCCVKPFLDVTAVLIYVDFSFALLCLWCHITFFTDRWPEGTLTWNPMEVDFATISCGQGIQPLFVRSACLDCNLTFAYFCPLFVEIDPNSLSSFVSGAESLSSLTDDQREHSLEIQWKKTLQLSHVARAFNLFLSALLV